MCTFETLQDWTKPYRPAATADLSAWKEVGFAHSACHLWHQVYSPSRTTATSGHSDLMGQAYIGGMTLVLYFFRAATHPSVRRNCH